MFQNIYYCFRVKQRSFQLLSDFLRTVRALIFLDFLAFSSQTPILSPQLAFPKLTFLYSKWIRNLNALASLPENVYLCIEMAEKAQFPGCLMNVVKMLDGRRKMEDVATPIL